MTSENQGGSGADRTIREHVVAPAIWSWRAEDNTHTMCPEISANEVSNGQGKQKESKHALTENSG